MVEFNAKLYLNHIKFKEEFSNFEKFMKSLIEEMEDEEEDNLLQYFNNNYLSRFKNLDIFQTPNDESIELSNILDKLLGNNKIDKKSNNQICLEYQAIKNNLFKDSLYKNSNAEQFFLNVLVQIEIIKSNLDFNFKNIYSNYIKELLYSFENINLNLMGNDLRRNINIENLKKKIENSYNECSESIFEKEKNLRKNAFEEIDNYIKNYDLYDSNSDPQKELNNIPVKISKLNEEFINFTEKKIKEYIDNLKQIREILQIPKNIDNLDIKVDNSIYKNFLSKGHGLLHIGIGVVEGIIRVCTAPFGPIGWGIAIAVHGIFTIGHIAYDKLNKKKTLLENLNKFKKELEIRFEGNENKIKEIILNLHDDILKELENYIDLKNAEFKGIKNKKKEFDNIFALFKKIYNEDNDL